MAIPAGYSQHPSGFWFYTDDSGPYAYDGTTMILATNVNLFSGPGRNNQFNRWMTAEAVKKFDLTADGLPVGWVGPGLITSIRCLTGPGAITGLYDAASAVGTNLMPALATAANGTYPLEHIGRPVFFDISPFFDITGGTYEVFGINGA